MLGAHRTSPGFTRRLRWLPTPTDPDKNPVVIDRVAANFMLQVPMTNPVGPSAGTNYLAEIHVYPKDEALLVTKTVDPEAAASVQVGQQVTYTIESSVPNGVEKTDAVYALTDQLDAALTFDVSQDSYRAVGTGVNCMATLTTPDDYVVTFPSTTRIMRVEFTATGRAEMAACDTVQFSFVTTVNEHILDNDRGSYTIHNEAELTITNEAGQDFTAGSQGKGADIHTAAIDIIVTRIDRHNRPLQIVAQFFFVFRK